MPRDPYPQYKPPVKPRYTSRSSKRNPLEIFALSAANAMAQQSMQYFFQGLENKRKEQERLQKQQRFADAVTGMPNAGVPGTSFSHRGADQMFDLLSMPETRALVAEPFRDVLFGKEELSSKQQVSNRIADLVMKKNNRSPEETAELDSLLHNTTGRLSLETEEAKDAEETAQKLQEKRDEESKRAAEEREEELKATRDREARERLNRKLGLGEQESRDFGQLGQSPTPGQFLKGDPSKQGDGVSPIAKELEQGWLEMNYPASVAKANSLKGKAVPNVRYRDPKTDRRLYDEDEEIMKRFFGVNSFMDLTKKDGVYSKENKLDRAKMVSFLKKLKDLPKSQRARIRMELSFNELIDDSMIYEAAGRTPPGGWDAIMGTIKGGIDGIF